MKSHRKRSRCSFWGAVRGQPGRPSPPGLPEHSFGTERVRYSGHGRASEAESVAVSTPGRRNKGEGGFFPLRCGDGWIMFRVPGGHVT